jgi:hypothetical protein
MLHMNLHMGVLSERAVGAGRVARRVGVSVGRCIGKAHVVGRGRVLASRQVARVVIV